MDNNISNNRDLILLENMVMLYNKAPHNTEKIEYETILQRANEIGFDEVMKELNEKDIENIEKSKK